MDWGGLLFENCCDTLILCFVCESVCVCVCVCICFCVCGVNFRVCFSCHGSTFVALPGVDNTGVKRCLV